jgi:predicted phosphodiesterase
MSGPPEPKTPAPPRYARIGVIGDIHAEDARLEQALDALAARGVELCATTGDVIDGRGSVERCCELLEARGVVAVAGNHDRWFLGGHVHNLPWATPHGSLSAQARRTLERLPPVVELATVAGGALLCHGLGANDLAKVDPDDHGDALETNDDLQLVLRGRHRWIINGHSHRRMVRHFPRVTIINAGTLRRDHEPGFLDLDFAAGVAGIFTFDAHGRVSPHVERIALHAGPGAGSALR